MWFRSNPFSFYIIVRFSPPKLHIFLQSTNYFHLLFINIGIFETTTTPCFCFSKTVICYLLYVTQKIRLWKLLYCNAWGVMILTTDSFWMTMTSVSSRHIKEWTTENLSPNLVVKRINTIGKKCVGL